MKWETDRARSGVEEKKAQSGERGSFVVVGHWTVWDTKLTSDLLGGSPWPSVAVRSAALPGGAHLERAPAWDLESSDNLLECGDVGMKG